MPKLTVVSAGAGTGKTYDLCDAISDAVVDGLDPVRILRLPTCARPQRNSRCVFKPVSCVIRELSLPGSVSIGQSV